MEQTKNVLKSHTLWAILITVLPTIFKAFGVENLIPILEDKQITGDEIIQILAAGYAIYCRYTATKQLTVTPKP